MVPGPLGKVLQKCLPGDCFYKNYLLDIQHHLPKMMFSVRIGPGSHQVAHSTITKPLYLGSGMSTKGPGSFAGVTCT